MRHTVKHVLTEASSGNKIARAHEFNELSKIEFRGRIKLSIRRHGDATCRPTFISTFFSFSSSPFLICHQVNLNITKIGPSLSSNLYIFYPVRARNPNHPTGQSYRPEKIFSKLDSYARFRFIAARAVKSREKFRTVARLTKTIQYESLSVLEFENKNSLKFYPEICFRMDGFN